MAKGVCREAERRACAARMRTRGFGTNEPASCEVKSMNQQWLAGNVGGFLRGSPIGERRKGEPASRRGYWVQCNHDYRFQPPFPLQNLRCQIGRLCLLRPSVLYDMKIASGGYSVAPVTAGSCGEFR